MTKIFDEDTGEILDMKGMEAHERKAQTMKEKPLLEAFSVEDVECRDDLFIRKSLMYPRGTGMLGCPDWELVLTDGEFDKYELKVLGHHINNLVYHNYGVILGEPWKMVPGIGRTSWYKATASLMDKNIFKIYNRLKDGGLLFSLHPFYGWVGHPRFRENALNSWVEDMISSQNEE